MPTAMPAGVSYVRVLPQDRRRVRAGRPLRQPGADRPGAAQGHLRATGPPPAFLGAALSPGARRWHLSVLRDRSLHLARAVAVSNSSPPSQHAPLFSESLSVQLLSREPLRLESLSQPTRRATHLQQLRRKLLRRFQLVALQASGEAATTTPVEAAAPVSAGRPAGVRRSSHNRRAFLP